MATSFASIESTASQAESLFAQGRFVDAERYYRELATKTHVIDYEYDDWLRSLAETYERLGRHKERGFIFLYLHFFDQALHSFSSELDSGNRARILQLQKKWPQAAEHYEAAKMPVHAAVCHEKAENFAAAASAWAEIQRDPALKSRPYEQALVAFNVGMSTVKSGGDPATGRRALVDAQQRLEQVADDFEIRGERERAFDCYQILLKLGKDSKQFENLSEGYINCIRVLRDDNLKFYVLQFYEDFVKLALERKELHAAATVYQEAADYAAKNGLPYNHFYQAKAGDTWALCAQRFLSVGAPVEMVENALLAAIACHSAVGNYSTVGESFRSLAKLDLGEAKQARYMRISERFDGASDSSELWPEFPEMQHAQADIWFADLLEWELGGEPKGVAASIIGDLLYPDGIRRRALVVVLSLMHAATSATQDEPQVLAEVAELLGELQSYAALNAIEYLYRHDSVVVRRAAVSALRFLFFKRSFSLIRQALEDSDEGVREGALRAISGLHFQHAFNSLARIFRETREPRVQSAVLESIGKIQSLEAGEFLLSVVRQEEGELRAGAAQALSAFDNDDITPIVRRYYEIERDQEVRTILRSLLGSTRAA